MADQHPDQPVDSVDPRTEPAGAEQRRQAAAAELGKISTEVQAEFDAGNRILSFDEYLALFAANPARHGRSAAHYVRDMFRHYGVEQLDRPWGPCQRYRLFDAPWADRSAAHAAPRLLGHEQLQADIFRVLSNFAREGRANRLLLMHGPNGSAKSTAAACILHALEDYSTRGEGALYRFHWIFPTRKVRRGSIGFGGGGEPAEEVDSYAHLDDDQIEARLVIELRDHPLFLIPGERRRPLLDQLWSAAGIPTRPPDWLNDGELSHKNKQIFEALLSSYDGSLLDVLRHVQVERFFISQRYRIGAVTLGPQMSVDAGERQVTADRSLSALPTSLQATTLFDAHGELVEAAGGVLEFSDLLKRPIDAFRYLQITLETAEVALPQQTIHTNVVMIGNANEIHMDAFRQHPEYPSFRGRLELTRVPYLRRVQDEQAIYDTLVVPHLRRHVAPHCTRLAAEFAVLTRMRRPDPGAYDESLAPIVEGLSAVEKLDLYADGKRPERLSTEAGKFLKANIAAVYGETDSATAYEGRVGVSPREIRTLLFDASQSSEYHCVSPFALLKGIEQLCKRESEFAWLKLEPESGGYHDYQGFRQLVHERLVDRIEQDVRRASGFIEEERYGALFRRYLNHVSAAVKKEKIRNAVTGKDEPPDASLMGEVEGLLGSDEEPEEHRQTIISTIAAWAIDNPGQAPVHDEIFPGYVERLQRAAFGRLREPFAALLRDLITVMRDDGQGLSPSQREKADQAAQRLFELGYDEHCGADAVSALLRDRYTDLVD
ncbi:MAG: serine protein kinase PrkA [Deltaproteobacteria bacterium]|nr:serine protein kinase PrkA [Deltaproteobacteria bacterium]